MTNDVLFGDWLMKYGHGVAKMALAHAKANCKSRTLRKSMRLVYVKSGWGGTYHAVVFMPQYWARYYHDGTQGRKLPSNKYLIVFRDPKRDPRIKRGYPTTRESVRSFWNMPGSWRYWKRKYNDDIKAKQRPPFGFYKSLGPNRPNPFLPSYKKMGALCGYHIKYDTDTALDKFIKSRMVLEGLKNKKRNITRSV